MGVLEKIFCEGEFTLRSVDTVVGHTLCLLSLLTLWYSVCLIISVQLPLYLSFRSSIAWNFINICSYAFPWVQPNAKKNTRLPRYFSLLEFSIFNWFWNNITFIYYA